MAKNNPPLPLPEPPHALPEQPSREDGEIQIQGAREHNLKNIDLTLPRNKLIVFSGLSGSGKSSLAFDTIYAEGQRRYMETFSAYARQFMGHMRRPEVDKINGLSPVISIEQKTVSRNPRSSVGTITEVYDFLRLLFARASTALSSATGKPMVRYTDDQILSLVMEEFSGKAVYILAPVVRGRKGHYRELFEGLFKSGYTKVRIDGLVQALEPKMQVSRYKIHDIELVVDRLTIEEKSRTRVRDSLYSALKQGKGSVALMENERTPLRYYSRSLMCADTGLAYDEPQPNTFSFNSPYGWCPVCRGLGYTYAFDPEDLMPDRKLSIRKGGIAPLGTELDSWLMGNLRAAGAKFGAKVTEPLENWPPEAIKLMLYGPEGTPPPAAEDDEFEWRGLIPYFENIILNSSYGLLRERLQEMSRPVDCAACSGYRLKPETQWFKLGGLHIGQAATLQLDKFHRWVTQLDDGWDNRTATIAREILKEIVTRTEFLLNIGLHYLSLNRPAWTLSGGEAQRIRLATQIGSQLINVTYILDEPSIGLHQRDNVRLIAALEQLRDLGNTVIVVEHDKDMIARSDYLVDLGPGAGVHGGEVMAAGPPGSFGPNAPGPTLPYITGAKAIPVPEQRRAGTGKVLTLTGARGHNLKNVDLRLPLGTLICITGVSGSGKSSLVTETLYPSLRRHLYRSFAVPLPNDGLTGLEEVDKVIEIDQSPIGRTPRSNPATYTGLFTPIRSLFAMLPEAKIRGYGPGRFSFNVKGGRCEDCGGGGMKVIEMNFLPDVQVECPTCMGKRYNRETLEVRYKGKSISDVLNMTVEHAVQFFEPIPIIKRKVKALQDVGLGYITLGQSSTTLSGGEAQRVKLATELSKKDTGKTFYILDEPTTGLHFEDISVLMGVLDKLVGRGNTVLVIEHNMDVIKLADWVIDIGPEGGDEGGNIVAEGTPETVAQSPLSRTAPFLLDELSLQPPSTQPPAAKAKAKAKKTKAEVRL